MNNQIYYSIIVHSDKNEIELTPGEENENCIRMSPKDVKNLIKTLKNTLGELNEFHRVRFWGNLLTCLREAIAAGLVVFRRMLIFGKRKHKE